MSEIKPDMVQIQKLIGEAFTKTGSLVALCDGGQMNADKLQKTLEQTMESFEQATLQLRLLCERNSPGAGNLGRKPFVPKREVTGSVEKLGYSWLHIQLNTLLPHCRYQTPAWLADTIRRLLDEYESGGNVLPYYERALLVIDEHSDIEKRRVFDQDNKGWKAISNVLKGRLIPDDDQYSLSVALLSTKSKEASCHITLLDMADASDFFSPRAGEYALSGLD